MNRYNLFVPFVKMGVKNKKGLKIFFIISYDNIIIDNRIYGISKMIPPAPFCPNFRPLYNLGPCNVLAVVRPTCSVGSDVLNGALQCSKTGSGLEIST